MRRTLIVLAVAVMALVAVTPASAQYPGYRWVTGSVVGAHHHGLTGHHLWVRDSFNGRTYTCTVPLATWLYDKSHGWANCWGRPGAL